MPRVAAEHGRTGCPASRRGTDRCVQRVPEEVGRVEPPRMAGHRRSSKVLLADRVTIYRLVEAGAGDDRA